MVILMRIYLKQSVYFIFVFDCILKKKKKQNQINIKHDFWWKGKNEGETF